MFGMVFVKKITRTAKRRLRNKNDKNWHLKILQNKKLE
jgi:hypothetical protein